MHQVIQPQDGEDCCYRWEQWAAGHTNHYSLAWRLNAVLTANSQTSDMHFKQGKLFTSQIAIIVTSLSDVCVSIIFSGLAILCDGVPLSAFYSPHRNTARTLISDHNTETGTPHSPASLHPFNDNVEPSSYTATYHTW